MRETKTHIYFYGGYLSNWYSCIFTIKTGDQFKNTEQAFMWMKANFFLDDAIGQELKSQPNPAEAKKLGRLIKNFDGKEWDCVKFGLMVYVNYLKFSQNEELKKWLIDTGDKILVEASPFDSIWGVGLGEDNDKILNEKNWNGQNLLGKALMKVRKLIK